MIVGPGRAIFNLMLGVEAQLCFGRGRTIFCFMVKISKNLEYQKLEKGPSDYRHTAILDLIFLDFLK